MNNKKLNWAVIGCGVIANQTAQALSKMNKTLYSVANRTHKKAVDFAKKHNIKKVYDSVDEVFYDTDVDIIYITTPHNTHYEFIK
ncbi:MAG: Gfo/Idh/MocA family oxidoreductase, partial [Acutalibacteraceae bacterium]|nr:Gfo/Idh/MocA family oxidoreductase [Acutalibacteraceae bacterium]